MNQRPPNRIAGMLKNRSFLLALGLVIVAAAGSLFWWSNRSAAKPETALPTVQVERGDISQTVAATGRVVPNFEVEIKVKASGKIIDLPFEVSDYVRKGQLLVALDPVDELRAVQQSNAALEASQEKIAQSRVNLAVAKAELQTEVDKAQANLNAALAREAEAQAKLNRLEELLRGEFISREEYEAGVTAAALADTDVKNARTRFNELKTQQLALNAREQDVEIARSEAGVTKVQLMQARQRLAETRIYAPIDGYITSKTGQIGQIVASGISNVGGGTSILTLADLSRIFVLASVDESDVGRVENGQPVKITVDAFPNETFMGKVVQVAAKGVNESDVVTFEVKIEVTSPNKSKLKPEMTANTEIIIAQKQNTLLLPTEAISLRDGKHYVTVVPAPGKTDSRHVSVGISNEIQTEVLECLRAGDRVVVHEGDSTSEWRKKPGANSAAGARRAGRMMMRGGRH